MDLGYMCERCIHEEVCTHKEVYKKVLREGVQSVVEIIWTGGKFDLIPDFIDIIVSCKYFREDKGVERTFS